MSANSQFIEVPVFRRIPTTTGIPKSFPESLRGFMIYFPGSIGYESLVEQNLADQLAKISEASTTKSLTNTKEITHHESH